MKFYEDMPWIPIKEGIPRHPIEVLLYVGIPDGPFDTRRIYSIGILGGKKNAPELLVENRPSSEPHYTTVPATHWCRLLPPKE